MSKAINHPHDTAKVLAVSVTGTVTGGDCSDNTVTVQVIGDVPSELWTMGEAVTLTHGHLTAPTDFDAVLADHNRLVRELDVLLNGEAGAADQASLCDIVAQVRMARKKPGTGALQLLALVPDQVVGRVHRIDGVADYPAPICGVLNSTGRALPDNAPLYARPADPQLRYVRAPSRKDPKYHEEWPEIEGGPVFDGVTYCRDLFEALKRFNVIVAETLPENAVDEKAKALHVACASVLEVHAVGAAAGLRVELFRAGQKANAASALCVRRYLRTQREEGCQMIKCPKCGTSPFQSWNMGLMHKCHVCNTSWRG